MPRAVLRNKSWPVPCVHQMIQNEVIFLNAKVWSFTSWGSGVAMGMKRSEKDVNGRAGKLFLCLIGVSLIGVGAVFGWLMMRSYQHAKESRDWPQVEVLVLRSEIDERQIQGSPREYRLNLLYGYSFDDKEISTNQFSSRGAKWSKQITYVEGLRDTYTVGSTHTAWVNPVRPDGAILVHDTKAAGYTLWVPALIIFGGAGMILGAVRGQGKTVV